MQGEPHVPRSAWRRRLDEHRRWLRRWLVEQGVEDPEATLWPVRDVAAERAVARVVERRPLSASELAEVQRWFIEARGQILKVLAMRRIPPRDHDDIAQEALARALAALGRFRPDSSNLGDSLRRWILGFARHVLHERQRTGSAREIPTEQLDDAPTHDLASDVLADLEQRGPALVDRLESLSDTRRAAWLAIDLEEAEIKAFAAATHAPYDTVCTNLKIARAKLLEPAPSPSGKMP
jgi:RNA polymerase sigma factor (sigma-70 family)